jgi:hypothetical protein
MSKTPYITITNGLRGYFAVLITLSDDGFEEPGQTGIGSYNTPQEAIPEAKSWANDEGIEFIDPLLAN